VYLPGLQDSVKAEVKRALSGVSRMWDVPGRDDAVGLMLSGSLAALLSLRTVVAPFVVLSFAVPRPRSLLSGEYLPQIANAVREAARLDRAAPARSLRIEAAGSDSTVMRTFASQLAQATGLTDEPEGECVVRLRRSTAVDGWDVLVRLSARPLSARAWRVRGHPAAANATVAAAMAYLTDPRPGDRVANLMCGSGTLLIERLHIADAAIAVGVDADAEALDAAAANLEAAGLSGRVELVRQDIGDDDWIARGPFDVLLADPPWGDKAGQHERNEAVHLALLERGYAAAAPGARFAVLTHEVRIMQRLLARNQHLWRLTSEIRVFHKGHHPRIYLLTRVDHSPGSPRTSAGTSLPSPRP
jgi:predicted RNA methylase